MSEVKEKKLDLAYLSTAEAENVGTQHAEIKPGKYTTFYGKEGRNYIIALTDMDDSYTAVVEIYDMNWGHRVERVSVAPFTGESVMVTMGEGNGVRVYNVSNEQSPGRPTVNASCYHA
ncbi:hypothetical protein [Vibrio spartinae]|uniref:Uncharacterized protein n=1 Tax=Vibrio spartinae TaxID=1918945 RepID=A0ABX6R5L0_9VIBR|nr:hypothetical protein [Vibrio spartinae]QMV16879.1 hypothetical protein Vspart_04298 [Vibrio spartinae]